MEDGHREDEDLVAQLFWAGHDDSDLNGCGDVRAQEEALHLGRERMQLPELRVSEEFLARQRQAVYRRLEQKPLRNRLQLAPVLSAVLLALVILTLLRTGTQRQDTSIVSDSAIFEDVFRTAAGTEPSALEPMRSLFEVRQ